MVDIRIKQIETYETKDGKIIENIAEYEDISYKVRFLKEIKDKKISEASEVLVEYVLNHLKIYTTKDDKNNEMWVYKEGIYISQGKSEVKELLRRLLGSAFSMYFYNLAIAKIEADTYIDIDNFFQASYPYLICVENGILNIKTRELKPFDSKMIFFNKLPVYYNSKSSCPQIEKFLEDVLAYKEDRSVIYELGGFSLLNEYKFEKAFMFIGNGRNGKDKTLELFKRIIGIKNCSSIPLSELKADSFSISELFGKKMNITGDISNRDLKETGTFKGLTGRSLICGKRKFLKDLTFENSAKLVFACNELPAVYDLSKGFWDRWVLLEFPYTFVTKEEYNLVSDKSNLKIRDEDIIQKITTKEELSGLLNKFLDGFDNLIKKRAFSFTKGSEEIKSLWIRKSNSFMAFCFDHLEEDGEGKINKKDLRKKYSDYCKLHKILSKSDVAIKIALQDMFGASEQEINVALTGYQYDKFWIGIKWK